MHPDARGSGTASRLLRTLLPEMASRGQGISVLFPTVVPLYRSLGWEVVGTLDDTRLATRDLAAGDSDCTVRSGEADRDGVVAGEDEVDHQHLAEGDEGAGEVFEHFRSMRQPPDSFKRPTAG